MMKNGSFIELEILDHSMGDPGHGECVCRVRGKVVRVTRKFVCVETWKLMADYPSENDEEFRIVRSAILRFRYLEPGEWCALK